MSCQITNTLWLMGTPWETDNLKSYILCRSDEVGFVSFPRGNLIFCSFRKSCFYFLFFFPHAFGICSGKHVLRKHSGSLCGVRLWDCCLLKTSFGSKNFGKVRAWGSWCMSSMSLHRATAVWRHESVGGTWMPDLVLCKVATESPDRVGSPF